MLAHLASASASTSSRAFRAAGAVTLGVDADPLAPALYHATASVIVPRIADPGYVPTLAALVERARRPPRRAAQRSRLPGARARARASSRRRSCSCPTPTSAPACRTSSRRTDFFVENGIPSPRSWAPEDVPDDARFPLLVKAREGFGSRHIYRAADPERARLLPRATRTCRSFVQEALPRRGVLDRRLLRHGRALPERDPAHDAPVEGRRVDQGRLDQGSRADRARRAGRRDRRHQGAGERAVLPRAGRIASGHGRQHALRRRLPASRSPPAAATRSSRSRSRAASSPSRGSATSRGRRR